MTTVSAKIISKFDLGYLLRLDNGGKAELRTLEMKGRELELHLKGKEENIYGELIDVFILYSNYGVKMVSQFTQAEREQREQIKAEKIQP